MSDRLPLKKSPSVLDANGLKLLFSGGVAEGGAGAATSARANQDQGTSSSSPALGKPTSALAAALASASISSAENTLVQSEVSVGRARIPSETEHEVALLLLHRQGSGTPPHGYPPATTTNSSARTLLCKHGIDTLFSLCGSCQLERGALADTSGGRPIPQGQSARQVGAAAGSPDGRAGSPFSDGLEMLRLARSWSNTSHAPLPGRTSSFAALQSLVAARSNASLPSQHTHMASSLPRISSLRSTTARSSESDDEERDVEGDTASVTSSISSDEEGRGLEFKIRDVKVRGTVSLPRGLNSLPGR